MARLTKSSIGLANCSSATISMWFQYDGQAAAGVCSYPLFEIGDSTYDEGGFYVALNGIAPAPLDFLVSAVGLSIYSVWPYYACKKSGASITYNSWHHVLASFDIGDSVGYSKVIDGTLSYMKPFRLIVDGVDCGTYNDSDGYVWSVQVAHRNQPGGTMILSRTDATLPSYRSDSPSARLRRYADVQVWVGTYLNLALTAVQQKFFTITGGKGYPVNPSIAAAAFGMQTYLFEGKASDNSFFVNRGTGGAFTKTGTASDFTPTPSF